MYWLDYILLVISLLLIVVIVLQNSKDDATSAFSGEKSELFANKKQRALEKRINQVTAILSVLFFVVALLLALIPRLY